MIGSGPETTQPAIQPVVPVHIPDHPIIKGESGVHHFFRELLEFILALPLAEMCASALAICGVWSAWIGLKKLRERRNNA